MNMYMNVNVLILVKIRAVQTKTVVFPTLNALRYKQRPLVDITSGCMHVHLKSLRLNSSDITSIKKVLYKSSTDTVNIKMKSLYLAISTV